MRKQIYQSEEALQKMCYAYFTAQYPKLHGLLNYNLNNSKNHISGAKNKALGLQAGRSDMVFYYCSKAYMIEFKTMHGIQSKAQKEWQAQIEAYGFEYYLCRSLPEFEAIIKNIIKRKN